MASYAVGFAIAFGTGSSEGDLIGTTGWLLQGAFCAVSLAIVWGTTFERIKFGAYVIYAIVFSALIYPIGSHWVFGGGWLQSNVGMQDFAGSTFLNQTATT